MIRKRIKEKKYGGETNEIKEREKEGKRSTIWEKSISTL